MSWLDKSDAEIRDEILTTASDETGLSNIKSKYGVARGIFEVLTKLVIAIYSLLRDLRTAASFYSATGFWLDLHALQCGVARKVSTKATGSLTGMASASGTLAAGAWVVIDGTELRYKITGDVVFMSGIAFAVPIEAELVGTDYNVESGTIGRCTKVIKGLSSLTFGAAWNGVPGTDDETDDSLRLRIFDRWRSLGSGNPPSKYEYLAESVTGVSEAKVIRAPRGYGSMDVVISSADGIPSAAVVESVRTALDSAGLACRDFLVRAAIAHQVVIEVEYKGDKTPEEMGNLLRQYVLAISIAGLLEVRSLYNDAVSGLDLTSFEVLLPDRNVQAGANEKLIPVVTVRRLV